MSLSDDYKKQLTELHTIKSFGNSKKISQDVKDIIITNNITSVLDFGCGKGYFSSTLRKEFPELIVHSYDPVTSPIDLPVSVDLIYSSDVLEHVEPAYLDDILINFNTISKYQYHLIACHPAKKMLSDGRNAHLIIEKSLWWKTKIESCLPDIWNMEYSKTYKKMGKTKKQGIIEQEKFIIFLKNCSPQMSSPSLK